MEEQKFNIAVIFAIALTAMVATALAATSLLSYHRVPSYGNVKAVKVGVYENAGCTNNLTSINWGILEPGASYNKNVWIKNIGSTKITLNMNTESWLPTNANSHITLSWNYSGQVLNVNQTINAVLTLTVLETIKETTITEFSFTLVIRAEEHTS